MSQSMTSHIPSADDLLAETKWIQNLARRLVGNVSRADDVAQDTLVIALENPPTQVIDQQGLRSWLAGVIRRVASHDRRAEVRRAHRQQVAAKVGFDPSSHDVVERYALQRRVAESVMALAEPYRSSLLLFYFDDLSVRAVGAATGAQVATVRKRLSRGRELLRESLDEEYGEDCRGWLRALVGAPVQRSWKRPVTIVAGVLLIGIGMVVWLNASPAESTLTYAKAEPDEGEPQDIVVASLSHAVPAFPEAQDDEQTAATLSEELGLELSSVTPLEVRKPLKEIKALAKKAGVKYELFRSAELFVVTNRNPNNGKMGSAIVARMFLKDVSERAYIVFAVAGQRPIGLGLWGTQEFDEDPDQRWGLFANQLLYRGRKSMIGADSATPAEIDQQLSVLFDDEEGGAFVEALIKQRALMIANTQYVRGVKLRAKVGAIASADWYPSLAQGMQEVANLSPALERVFEQETGEHGRLASEAATKYSELSAAVQKDDRQRFEELDSELGDLCHACHDATLSDGETLWFDALDPIAKELDLPRGVMRVGYDLAPALGDDGALSEAIASAFRAGLMYLDALK